MASPGQAVPHGLGEQISDLATIQTALDIDLNDSTLHQVGHCLVHTAVFQDIGLVW